jgi:phosphopantetheine adenylyltransferase
MPNGNSKHQILAQLCVVTSGETCVLARGLKDKNPFTQRVVQQDTNVRLQPNIQTVCFIEFPRTEPALIYSVTVKNL